MHGWGAGSTAPDWLPMTQRLQLLIGCLRVWLRLVGGAASWLAATYERRVFLELTYFELSQLGNRNLGLVCHGSVSLALTNSVFSHTPHVSKKIHTEISGKLCIPPPGKVRHGAHNAFPRRGSRYLGQSYRSATSSGITKVHSRVVKSIVTVTGWGMAQWYTLFLPSMRSRKKNITIDRGLKCYPFHVCSNIQFPL